MFFSLYYWFFFGDTSNPVRSICVRDFIKLCLEKYIRTFLHINFYILFSSFFLFIEYNSLAPIICFLIRQSSLINSRFHRFVFFKFSRLLTDVNPNDFRFESICILFSLMRTHKDRSRLTRFPIPTEIRISRSIWLIYDRGTR